MSEIKLLPCPFCGREEIEETYYSFMPVLKCKICGAIMTIPASFRGNYRTELARKWNTRKPMQEILEELEEYPHGKYTDDYAKGFSVAVNIAINMVKEVGGMNDSKN